MPPLVSPQKLMTSKKRPKKFHTDDASLHPTLGNASDWLASSNQKHYPDMPHASSVWFPVVVSQMSFHSEISVGVAKCCLFSQITSYHTDLSFNDAA